MAAIPIFLGKIQISGVPQGFSESYYLKASTLADAKTALSALVNLRKAMLHNSLEIEYACVSQLGVNRDSYIVTSDPVPGSDTVVLNAPNRIEDCIRIRCESATGRICTRYCHGVPDPAAVNGAYVRAAVAAFDTALDAYVTGLSANTGFLNKVNPTDKTTWTVDTWGTVVRRGLGFHKVGRPFDLRRGRRPTA